MRKCSRLILTSAIQQEEMKREMDFLQRRLDELPDRLLSLGVRVVLALLLFAIGTRVIALIRRIIKRALSRSNASTEAVQFLDSAIKSLLYVVLVFMILQLFGVQAASIATVIGSVGVTVGLAIQGSLANCIGGIMILTLKPFKVGDYIIEDTYRNEGIVREITIFYTKLSTHDNKLILIPNGTLANSSLTNVTQETQRRIDLTVGISYEADIRHARAVVERLAAEHPLVSKEKDVSVFIDNLGDSSVVLAIRFWAKREDFWQARCEMLENIKYAFDEEGIQIPYNQVEVHLHRCDSDPPAKISPSCGRESSGNGSDLSEPLPSSREK